MTLQSQKLPFVVMESLKRARSAIVDGKKTVLRHAAGLKGQSIPCPNFLAHFEDPRHNAHRAKDPAVTETAASTSETNVGTTMDVVVTVTVMDVGFSVLQAYLNQTRLSATKNTCAIKG